MPKKTKVIKVKKVVSTKTKKTIENAKLSPPEKSGGNTKPRLTSAKHWLFTLNNWTPEERQKIIDTVSTKGGQIIFGQEIGEEGTPHLQGFYSYPEFKKGRPMETFNFSNRFHWEKMIKPKSGNVKKQIQFNIDYCGKDNEEVYTNVREWRPKKKLNVKTFEDLQLRPWQLSAERRIHRLANDDRHIMWLWDNGNTGKSTFTRYLIETYNAYVVSGAGKYCLSAIMKLEKKPELIIYSIPRDKENYVSYAAIEALRDGVFFSGFGTEGTGMCNMGFNPVVVVMCNFAPDLTKMSIDRWLIYMPHGDKLKDTLKPKKL